MNPTMGPTTAKPRNTVATNTPMEATGCNGCSSVKFSMSGIPLILWRKQRQNRVIIKTWSKSVQ